MAVGKRKCKSCCDYVREFIVTPKGVFCSFEVAAKWGYANKAKGAEIKRKTADKVHAVKKRKMKDNDKPLREKAAQAAFNAFIRFRDDALSCISCGRHHTGQYHAGHYRSRGAHPELRFEELNCHKQCAPCNNHLSGNISNYRPALIEKLGLVRMNYLEGPHEPKKYTCAELKEIELLYKQKLKDLQ